jgi:glyoxylase-like metal-dependent hydrolase (beta-lactamase superfamily II)
MEKTMRDEPIRVKQDQTTAYLLEGSRGFLQVDTGYAADYDTYRRFLEKRDIAPVDIRYLLLTHHHDDHAGYLNALTSDNPSIRIITHEKSRDLLRQGRNDTSNGGGLLNRRIYALFRLKQMLTPDWDLTFDPFELRDHDLVFDGGSLRLPEETGLDGVLLHTPGHTSDSISLLLDDGRLFCGDLASNFLNWAGAHHATLFNENMAELYASWKTVLDAGARRIYPAHGAPFDAAVLRREMDRHSNEDLVRFF